MHNLKADRCEARPDTKHETSATVVLAPLVAIGDATREREDTGETHQQI